MIALFLLLSGRVSDFARLLAELVVIGLLAGWIEWMRRETLREFPDAATPAFLLDARDRVAESFRSGRAAATTTTVRPAPAQPVDLTGRLQELADLHARGELTDEEYAAAKARVLAGE